MELSWEFAGGCNRDNLTKELLIVYLEIIFGVLIVVNNWAAPVDSTREFGKEKPARRRGVAAQSQPLRTTAQALRKHCAKLIRVVSWYGIHYLDTSDGDEDTTRTYCVHMYHILFQGSLNYSVALEDINSPDTCSTIHDATQFLQNPANTMLLPWISIKKSIQTVPIRVAYAPSNWLSIEILIPTTWVE